MAIGAHVHQSIPSIAGVVVLWGTSFVSQIASSLNSVKLLVQDTSIILICGLQLLMGIVAIENLSNIVIGGTLAGAGLILFNCAVLNFFVYYNAKEATRLIAHQLRPPGEQSLAEQRTVQPVPLFHVFTTPPSEVTTVFVAPPNFDITAGALDDTEWEALLTRAVSAEIICLTQPGNIEEIVILEPLARKG